jgi:hypothetical protein
MLCDAPNGSAARDRPAGCAVPDDLKTLYTSGYSENAIVHHGRLDSGVLLLAKPYRKSELARMIRLALTVEALAVEALAVEAIPPTDISVGKAQPDAT